MMMLSTTLSYVMALVSMTFLILTELKMLGYLQSRKGPNKVSLMGIPQPTADAMKLFTKEPSKPSHSNTFPFFIAPAMNLFLALLFWNVIPSNSPPLLMKFGVILFLCISSLSVYTTLMAGWSSNSKFALLGSLRSIAQTISYEVSMSLILISTLLFSMTLNTQTILHTQTFSTMLICPILLLIWTTTTMAETNRAPFDFVEGESELVSGFNTEYSSNSFALIFMAEYLNILFMSLLTALLMSQSHLSCMPWPLMSLTLLMTKTMLIAIIFIISRASLPRLRYDRLMNITWMSFLPLSLMMIALFTALT